MKWLVVVTLSLLGSGCEQVDFRYADGTPGRYADWTGRWVVVNYWAEWCAPCRYEIPELNELARETGAEVLVVGVNYDGLAGVELTELVKSMGIEFRVLTTDPQVRWAYDRPSVLPTTVLINPAGEVAGTLVGPQTRDRLETALGIGAVM